MRHEITSHRLSVLIGRIERLVEEKDAITSDIRDIIIEAEDSGYGPALRAVARELRWRRFGIETG